MKENPKHTSVFKLFHYYFKCQISAAFALQGRTSRVGSEIHASDADALGSAMHMVSKQHTAVEMAELFSRGARVILSDPDDSIRIYEWLQDHLQTQKSAFATNIHTGRIPLDDLAILDIFASNLYRVTREHEKIDNRVGAFGRAIRKVAYTRIPKRITRIKSDSKPVLPKEHNSIAADINRLAISRTLPNSRGK